MSGPPRVKSMNQADSELRPVLAPAGNKARSVELRKPAEKLKVEKKVEAMPVDSEKKCGSILRRKQLDEQRSFPVRSNLWMNASCSSDASSDSSQSRASTGRVSCRSSITSSSGRKKQQCGSKVEKIGKAAAEAESLALSSDAVSVVKKRCSWVTSNTDPVYRTFHDEEWGVPVHDDRDLFELLCLCTALAELTWPAILSRRQAFRDVFHNFDPVAVSKLNENKISAQGNPASSLLSELKLRAFIDNARQICKIIDEFGSFKKYIWDFVNNKPVVNNFRYPRQVPIKTSKAEMISKDLVRRGFRGVGPTVVYSFMQVAGITNDHLISCFRFQDCIAAAGDARNKSNNLGGNVHIKDLEVENELQLERAIDDLSLSS